MKRTRKCMRTNNTKKRSSVTQSQLHNLGYEIHHQFTTITPKTLKSLKRLSERCGKPIFNHSESRKRNDFKRVQTNLTPSRSINLVNQLIDELNTKLKELYPFHQPNNWVIIQSKDNCGKQVAHTDYVSSTDMARVSDDLTPLAVLVCLEPDTRLYVWPKSIRLINLNCNILGQIDTIESKCVKLNVGDILIFRGDLVHAGAEYQKSNIRLHSYMDTVKVKRSKNTTYLIEKHAPSEVKRIMNVL